MKKTYFAPALEIADAEASEIIATSQPIYEEGAQPTGGDNGDGLAREESDENIDW